MVKAGIKTFGELGPGRVLAGLISRIDKSTTTYSVGDPEGLKKAAEALGRPELARAAGAAN